MSDSQFVFHISYYYTVMIQYPLIFFFFFFNDTATTEIYTLSLHDALPILPIISVAFLFGTIFTFTDMTVVYILTRSEEHTSELQSHSDLVCRLLLEKKKKHNQ